MPQGRLRQQEAGAGRLRQRETGNRRPWPRHWPAAGGGQPRPWPAAGGGNPRPWPCSSPAPMVISAAETSSSRPDPSWTEADPAISSAAARGEAGSGGARVGGGGDVPVDSGGALVESFFSRMRNGNGAVLVEYPLRSSRKFLEMELQFKSRSYSTTRVW
ncbi:hypothetical protein OsJ_35738 [Oryza sativa Japonica Group]|uniref:Uncharacterized protein n=1 Tax=Oryza sativa subsp. japonica TaxID=39947 RepID=B9GCL7_ORYSJ|nr:hypothetical protein OsJ_35738 [Oryza sativa Japonica Group]